MTSRLKAILGMQLIIMLALVNARAEEPARIAIIIDDIGYQTSLDEAVLRLDTRIAIAVIPDGPEAKKSAQAATATGREVLIHLPLPHPQGVCLNTYCPTEDWSANRLLGHLKWAGRRVPGAVGISNHQGSLFTADPGSTRRLVESVAMFNRKNRPLFVLDSRTTSRSRLAEEASRAGLRVAERQIFLDHDREPEAVRGAWQKLLERALTDGQAIAIGHPYPETIELLSLEIPALDEQRIQLVTISALVSSSPKLDQSGKYKPSPLPIKLNNSVQP